ncbi:hypothetical protein [Streptomyces sp. NPDC002265]|uniref:hypothetical protein n=1 Tax=Streptomyces sp. NPDC002265 TaxID=3154415 RepID=UPI003327FC00
MYSPGVDLRRCDGCHSPYDESDADDSHAPATSHRRERATRQQPQQQWPAPGRDGLHP